MNIASVEVDAAPSFYAVATSGPIFDDPVAMSRICATRSPFRGRSARSATISSAPPTYTEALIRIREAEAVYRLDEGTVDFEEQTLFRTSVALPANLIEGNYAIRIFLTRDGRVVDRYETTIGVQKVGLERWLYNLAQEQPPVYGLLALALAMLAGWGASAAFRFIRR